MTTVTVLNGKYRLDRLIGQGGFGEVYVATDLTLQRQVAVKLIKDDNLGKSDMLERFLNEARLTSQLKHPNTLTIYDFGKHEKQLFLVSELLEGEDLRSRLKKVGHLQPHEMIDLFIPICKALHEAHEVGVIHRDLKPDNLYLHSSFGEEKLVLLDFGIAKTLNQTHRTQTGHLIGTPYYMAPEQITQSKSINHTSDIYSLGVIFYEVLSGTEPYRGDSIYKIFEQHMKGDIPRIDLVVAAELEPFESLISSMLAKSPKNRPQSALAIAQALEQIKSHVSTKVDLSDYLTKLSTSVTYERSNSESQTVAADSLDETLLSMEQQAEFSLRSQSDLGLTLDQTQNATYPNSNIIHDSSSVKVKLSGLASNFNKTADISIGKLDEVPLDLRETRQQHRSFGQIEQDKHDHSKSSFDEPADFNNQINISVSHATKTDTYKSQIRSKSIVVNHSEDSIQSQTEHTTAPSSKTKLPLLLMSVVIVSLLVVVGMLMQQHNKLNDIVVSTSKPNQGLTLEDHAQLLESKKNEVGGTSVKTDLTVDKVTQNTKLQDNGVVVEASNADQNKDAQLTNSAKQEKQTEKPITQSIKKSSKKNKRSARNSSHIRTAKGLSIQLKPKYTSYVPKDKSKLFVKFRSGEVASNKLRVRFIPKTLGKFQRAKTKTVLKQSLQFIGTIKWGSKQATGKIKVCLAKECKLQSVVIIDKIDKNLDFSTDGINLDDLE